MKVTKVKDDSPAEKADIKFGDDVVKINGRVAVDFLDLLYYKDEPAELEIRRDGKLQRIFIRDISGIDVEKTYRRCENNCFFCFVDGLPQGLRRSLYFKDDDYRLSFLFGNYLSMTNLDNEDIDRIGRLRLSPLYISVHSTNSQIRQQIFANERAGLIMEQLKRLASLEITMHTQIVLIPGINDDGSLLQTLDDLMKFNPYVASIAIVPCGRTRYNYQVVPETTPSYAQKLINKLKNLYNSVRHPQGHNIIQLADEYYLMCREPLPDKESYGCYPQIENGCGMVVKLNQEIRNLQPAKRCPADLYLVTSRSPHFFLNPLLEHLHIPPDRVIKVANNLFGDSVWVSGLLSGEDVLKATKNVEGRFLIPDNAIFEGRFIDDVRLDQCSKFILAPSSVEKLARIVENL